ncbi:MAG: NUDIX hydrolase [Arachnia sp.]
MSEPSRAVIVVSAVVIRDHGGRLLVVRKHGTTRFMNPGGKPEPGESARQAAVREVREELGLDIAADELEALGHWRLPAANEPGHDVDATVFMLTRRLSQAPEPLAELAEVKWLDPLQSGDPDGLAPLLRGPVLSALA